MSGRRVVLLSGWKRSGKDTVAEYLVGEYGYVQLSIAGALKDLVSRKYGIPRADLDDQGRKEAPLRDLPVVLAPGGYLLDLQKALLSECHYRQDNLFLEQSKYYWTPRALCILEGSIARAVDPGYWLRAVAYEIADNPGTNYVVSDVRYRSEISALKLAAPEAVLWRVSGRVLDPGTTDPSERDLDNCPYDLGIDNSGTPGELYSTIRVILS